jgi:hypothetical protein
MRLHNKKNIISIFAVIITFLIVYGNVIISQAATGNVVFSDPVVNVDESVTVTMYVETSGTPIGSADLMLSYDASLLEFTGGNSANGGAGSIKVVGFATSGAENRLSFQLNFKALQAGTARISVASHEVYAFNEEAVNIAGLGSSSVTIKAPASFSNDSRLSALSLSQGGLTPAFSPDIMSYTASVSEDVTRLVVGANTRHQAAKLAISGNSNLVVGANTISIRVTAEDNRTVSTYVINVTRAGTVETTANNTDEESTEEATKTTETNQTILIDGVEYTVAEVLPEDIEIPDNFTQVEYTYNGMQVMALKSNTSDIVLLYLVDTAGNGEFYIYDETKSSFERYQAIVTETKRYIILPFDADDVMPSGYNLSEVKIMNQNFAAWVTDIGEEKFCIFRAINDKGIIGLYRYDFTDETIQRYTETVSTPLETEDDDYLTSLYNKLMLDYETLKEENSKYFWVVLGLGLLSFILMIILINMFIFNKRGKKNNSKDDFQLNEDEEIEELSFDEISDGSSIEFLKVDPETSSTIQDKLNSLDKLKEDIDSIDELLNSIKVPEKKSE